MVDPEQPLPDLLDEGLAESDLSLRSRGTRVALGVLLGSVIVGLVGATLVGGGGPSSRSRRQASPAPSFRLADLRDPSAAVSLDDFAGHPLVINFWASWCVPCAKEMPDFEAVHDQVKDRVAFLGINHLDPDREAALALLQRTRVRYRAAADPQGKLAPAYGIVGMPGTVFVDGDGRVVYRHTGPLTRDELRKKIQQLFPSDRGPD